MATDDGEVPDIQDIENVHIVELCEPEEYQPEVCMYRWIKLNEN
jgi:hypothetical protein